MGGTTGAPTRHGRVARVLLVAFLAWTPVLLAADYTFDAMTAPKGGVEAMEFK